MILTADALAFDMDGTLVDSHAVILSAWTDWANRHGLRPAEVIAFCHGRPLHRIVAHFLPDGDIPGEAEWWLHRLPDCEDQLRPVLGAPALLETLAPNEWALVTSAPAELARRWMSICGLPLPDVVITADDVTHPKPDPEPFATAARLLGHPPARVLAFEDSVAGLRSAADAGLATVGLGGATGSAASIADYSAVIRQPGQPIRLHLPG